MIVVLENDNIRIKALKLITNVVFIPFLTEAKQIDVFKLALKLLRLSVQFFGIELRLASLSLCSEETIQSMNERH